MNIKTRTNILVWVLSLAVLLVVFVYSTNVSRNLYHSVAYFDVQQGVSFHGKITNAPKSGINYDSYQEIEAPRVVNSYLTSSSSYNNTASSNNIYNTQFQPNRSETGGIGSSVISTASQFGGLSNSTKVNALNGVGFSGLLSNSRSAGLSQATNTPGFSSLSEDLAVSIEMSNRQSAGGVDPGGDPTDPPLPVGDGFWFLLILAIVYMAWKYNRTRIAST